MDVGRGEVGERGMGLHPDEVTEHLERDEVVTFCERDQLRSDGVPPARRTRNASALHEHGVQRERQHRRISEPARECLGVRRRCSGAIVTRAARLQRDDGQQSRPHGRQVVAQRRQHPPGCRDDVRGLGRVVGAHPHRRHVVRRDDPSGQARVAHRFGRRDRLDAVPPGCSEIGRARHGKRSQQRDRRLQVSRSSDRDRILVGARRATPHVLDLRGRTARRGAHEVFGVVEDVALQPAQRRPRRNADLLLQPDARAAQHGERVGLTVAAVQRQAQKPPRVFAPWVLGHMRVELHDRLIRRTDRDPRLRAALDGQQAQLRQAGGLDARPVVVGYFQVCGAPPQRQRLIEHGDARLGRS